jgi:hypothetical protein
VQLVIHAVSFSETTRVAPVASSQSDFRMSSKTAPERRQDFLMFF